MSSKYWQQFNRSCANLSFEYTFARAQSRAKKPLQNGRMKRRHFLENYHGRPDWLTRALVDAGLELGCRDGYQIAAKFMHEHSISFPIALRSLRQAGLLAITHELVMPGTKRLGCAQVER
jgi:hypothetical protein